MDNLAKTTELQKNPDRGLFYHFPWFYWPTGIKNLDINFFNIFLVKMDNMARTKELQENPDRGSFYHFPWLYWPTGIKYLDVSFFNISRSKWTIWPELRNYRKIQIGVTFAIVRGSIGLQE